MGQTKAQKEAAVAKKAAAEADAPTAEETQIVGYRYKCNRTCFFEGARVFEGHSIDRTEPLPPEQATFFNEPREIVRTVAVADDAE